MEAAVHTGVQNSSLVLSHLRLLVVWFTLLSANFRPRVLHHLRSTTTTPPPTFRQTMAQESSFLTMPSPAQMSSATQQQPPVVASSGQAPGHPSFRRYVSILLALLAPQNSTDVASCMGKKTTCFEGLRSEYIHLDALWCLGTEVVTLANQSSAP